ncbi:MAG: hypothetical protein LBI55_00525 [Oscillospiraceae bacterium]|nr:hypothetical protein [Oscillospiraceae bacterium]
MVLSNIEFKSATKPNIVQALESMEIRNSAILVDERLIVTNDTQKMHCVILKDGNTVKNIFYPLKVEKEKFDSYVSEAIKEKAKFIIKNIREFDSEIGITDFQLTRILTKTSINLPGDVAKNRLSEEYLFEVEIQKKINGNAILGSSYIYKSKLENIKIEDIMKTLTFPYNNTEYQEANLDEKYDLIVWGKPIFSSIMENLVYYTFMDYQGIEKKSNITIYDDPTHDKNFNYISFDDKGNDTTVNHLYGYDNGYKNSSIHSEFLIPNKKCYRDMRSCFAIHPTNIILESKNKIDTLNKFKEIKRGLYCHLMVGNHFCSGDFIEGTVFNAFTIKDGKLDISLAPFKIKINKKELLKNIAFIGNDYEFVRPFPWWTPIVTKIPTVFTKSISLRG